MFVVVARLLFAEFLETKPSLVRVDVIGYDYVFVNFDGVLNEECGDVLAVTCVFGCDWPRPDVDR